MKEPTKEAIIPYVVSFIGIIVLVFTTYLKWSNMTKLLVGGALLIIEGLYELCIKRQQIYLIFPFLGITSLIVAFLIPNNLMVFLLCFYFMVFVATLLFAHNYKKKGDKYEKKDRPKEILFRISYFIGSFLAATLFWKVVRAVIKEISTPNFALSWIYYVLAIMSFIILLFWLCIWIDSLLQLIKVIRHSKPFLNKVYYSAYYSIAIGICISVLLIGYYYISSSTGEEMFRRFAVIIGLAFFTSVVVANSLRELIKTKANYKRY